MINLDNKSSKISLTFINQLQNCSSVDINIQKEQKINEFINS